MNEINKIVVEYQNNAWDKINAGLSERVSD